MSNKITCTCGHSWNKSSSSKKDMRICHICGKDNTMKNGGWLDTYDEEMQLGGFVYPTNYIPEAQNGIEGTMGGLTDQGFNYNGAWGGTMENGGDIPQAQNGIYGGLNFLEPTSKKLPEGYNPKAKGSSTEYATSIGGEDGELAYLIPSFKYGKLLDDPNTEFKRTGDYLGGPFKTWQEADEWERDVRHPYVEKGQNIPTPLKRWGKDFAMGGAMPGSVGFSYARTKGIPSEGPYAKKTMPSAQNGEEVEYKELPEITVVGSKDKSTRDFYNNLINKFSEDSNSNNPFVDEGIMKDYLGIMNLGKEYGFPKVKTEKKEGIFKNAKGHYNPLTKTIYGNDPNTWVSEMAHHVQMKDNVIGKGLQWLGNDLVAYAKKPVIELKNSFKYGIDSSPLDYSQEDFNEWADASPYEKEGAVEHEAHSKIEPMLKEKIKRSGEEYVESPAAKARRERFFAERKLQNGGEMKFYQEGLDWKPRNISEDGTSVKKPTVKLSPEELKMERLKQYAQQQSRKEQPIVQSRGSMPDSFRQKLFQDAQNAALRNQLLKGADIATDVMQVGNFIPHPAAQAIGELGNMLGGWVDSYEAYDAYNKGNYGDVATNAASVALPMVLGSKGYRRDMWNTEPGSVADKIASLGNREGRYIHLTPHNRLKNNPVIKKGVNFNRSLLGTLGAETAYDSYKKGGKITKDDNGYWNPENWGKPVEIGSNEITMQGVYEPLLGISDTGDTKMMYPGEDYEFDGESVTEYPVAQNGWLEKYAEGGDILSDKSYDIQKGDTLSNISSRYNIPLATLANANQLENPNLIQAGKKLNIPTQAKKELTFDEIPTADSKKVVIDNFSKHYDYIVEGDQVYYKTKGGKTWADISNNKTAQSNLLKFIEKNDYWAGYNSSEKELLKTGQAPKKPQVQVDLPKLTPINTRAVADATQVTKTLTKPKSTVKEEPSVFDDVTNYLKSEVSVLGGKAKKLEKQVENTIGEVKSSVESGINKAVQTVEDLYNTGINGIKRKIATHTGEDDDVEVKAPKINKPRTVSEYYGNKTGAEISAVVDVPDGSGRQFKQQVLPTSSVKFGVRNRGEYKDIKTDGLEITTFNPFTKDKLPDNTTVLAIDTSGNLHTGVYKDFKNQKGFMFSKTFRNKIVDFAESNGKAEYVSGEKSGNPKYNQPKVKVMNDNGKVVDGSLNVLVKDDSKKDYYGSVQGGRILFVNPETKEQYLVSGSMNHIKNEFKRIKGNNKYLEAYTLDNGTYSRGLSYKDKKLTPERLKKYDLENTGGGNGLFIVDYEQPVSKFREEYIEGMPNIRTEKDESYKKGHPLRNEIKNIVLHHTAYTGPDAEKEVTAQYMSPGQNTSHIVIQKNGKRTVYASPEQVTFHAGQSKWNNRDNVNDFSIGVEFQGDTNKTPLTQAQVESFVEYYAPIAKKYNLSLKDVITHQMIAPGRKPDIAEKEYQRILKYMKEKNLK